MQIGLFRSEDISRQM